MKKTVLDINVRIEEIRKALTPRPSRQRYYLCRCACGTERSVRRSALVSGQSPNCGCGGGI